MQAFLQLSVLPSSLVTIPTPCLCQKTLAIYPATTFILSFNQGFPAISHSRKF